MSGEQSKNPEFFDQDSMMIYIDPKVMSSLSDMAEKKQEDLKALQVAAEEGDLDAQYRLGRSYYYGEDGAPRDGEKAFEWFGRAAEGGSIAAQYYLGLCYSREVGTDKDLVRAAELFMAAAEEGYPPAITELGLCYELGHGVEMDKGRRGLTRTTLPPSAIWGISTTRVSGLRRTTRRRRSCSPRRPSRVTPGPRC